MTIRAAIFDFDELLIDLQTLHFAADRAALAALGHDYGDLPDAIRLGGSGRRISELLAEMRDHFGIADSVECAHAAAAGAFSRRPARCPHAPRDARCSRGDQCTSRRRVSAGSNILRYPGVHHARAGSPRHQRSLRRDYHRRGRDAWQAASGAVSRHRRTARPAPAACVVFEDATVGVLAAKAAGMRCIAVPNPDAMQPQDLSAADLVLPSLTAFTPALLARWN